MEGRRVSKVRIEILPFAAATGSATPPSGR
jgi:hypothetical protein